MEFDLLSIINQERKKFGIRDSDYHRYRVHCTHKLKTLRRSKTTTTNDQKDLLITLFQVEHAWASSRELKEQVQSIILKHSDKTGASRVRKHANSRLTKAIHHADRFFKNTNPLSIQSLAQVHVHRLYMKGLLDFELNRHNSALDHFSISCVILRALGNSIDNDHIKRAIFNEFIDELAPIIRFCSYKINDSTTVLDIESFSQDRFDANSVKVNQILGDQSYTPICEFIESSKSIVHELIELRWLDKLIPIRNPELIEIVSNVQKADQVLLSRLTQSPTDDDERVLKEELTKRQRFIQTKHPKTSSTSPSKAYDRALTSYENAESMVQKLVEFNTRAAELNSTIHRFDHQSIILTQIHNIVGFRLLSTRIQRDLILIKKLENTLINHDRKIEARINNKKLIKNYQLIDKLITNKPNQKINIKTLLINRRKVKVYPSLLKLIEHILYNLEMLKALKLVEDDQELTIKIDCKVSFFKAYKCLIQSKSYLLIDKFLESYSLQEKSKFYVRQTRLNLDQLSPPLNEQEEEGTGDLNESFLKFESDLLGLIGPETQESLKLEIIEEWWKSKGHAEDEENGAINLKTLSLTDQQGLTYTKGSTHQVYDLAFNYLTQFDWTNLDPNSSSTSSTTATDRVFKTQPNLHASTVQAAETSSAAQPRDDDTPVKKSTGLWSFFSRS
ncbi:hypothetical protein PSTT_15243 [Puccinia striiformis]|uniref:Signal recognition particle subunit SRP68 n=1 Tax=Puccinia striiformis TaxID=27350 RepID=A0A2S4UIM2_9BASI|nr:hypothetical protein PSTT_15243 [Puccinia striiformis]